MLEVAATFLSEVRAMPLGTWAEWFSGVMSMLAVFVALFLASTARKTKVMGFCHNRFLIHPDVDPVQVTVTANNIGRRTVTIAGIQICRVQCKFAKWRSRVSPLHLERDKNDRLSASLPKTLPDGESATWHFLEGPVIRYILRSKMVETEKDVRALRCVFITNLGKNFAVKLDQDFVQSIIRDLSYFHQRPE